MLSSYFGLYGHCYSRLEPYKLGDAAFHFEIFESCTRINCVKFWDSSFEWAEYIKPKIQLRQLFASLTIDHLENNPFRCHL
jgi:hypothetical protein